MRRMIRSWCHRGVAMFQGLLATCVLLGTVLANVPDPQLPGMAVAAALLGLTGTTALLLQVSKQCAIDAETRFFLGVSSPIPGVVTNVFFLVVLLAATWAVNPAEVFLNRALEEMTVAQTD